MNIQNINPKQNPVTSIIGGILILIAVLLFSLPVFIETKQVIVWYIPTGIGVVGILLMLSPDTLIGIIKNKSDKI